MTSDLQLKLEAIDRTPAILHKPSRLFNFILKIISEAKTLDGALENLDALAQFCDRHELVCAMRDANIAGTDDDRLSAEFFHLRRFRAERNRPGLPRGRVFEHSDE